ncbi:unnamed protein product [Paramecium sonneborni]|uniref:Uncharacterized protein n=1 Tax=Paramecium sonneborni TaxID=65129 RepID=A0A8S1RMP7_9CILI|nr:unnamed protein product [Paramecium sonneborni]
MKNGPWEIWFQNNSENYSKELMKQLKQYFRGFGKDDEQQEGSRKIRK